MKRGLSYHRQSDGAASMRALRRSTRHRRDYLPDAVRITSSAAIKLINEGSGLRNTICSSSKRRRSRQASSSRSAAFLGSYFLDTGGIRHGRITLAGGVSPELYWNSMNLEVQADNFRERCTTPERKRCTILMRTCRMCKLKRSLARSTKRQTLRGQRSQWTCVQTKRERGRQKDGRN